MVTLVDRDGCWQDDSLDVEGLMPQTSARRHPAEKKWTAAQMPTAAHKACGAGNAAKRPAGLSEDERRELDDGALEHGPKTGLAS